MEQLELSHKQNEYILNANARWNFKVGAVRSGKSFVDIAFIIPSRIRAVAGKQGLTVIMGVSRDTIERNVLEPMREIYTRALVGRINNRNQAIVFGELVYCLGAEKVSQVAKIQGASIKYCYGDEVAKWNEEVFELLKSRLDKEYSCFDGSLNPEYPNHWLKAFLDNKKLDKYIQHYIIDDNPFLPKEYVQNLKNEYEGTVYYDRYILGRWALAEGLVYPMYQNAIVDEVPDTPIKEQCISIDYGTMNAFAMLYWERHPDGIWYATRRYYYSGRASGVQKTDTEYLRDIETVLFDVIDDLRQARDKVADPDTYVYENVGKLETIIDPSAASFIALLRKTDWAKVRPADNAVLDGIRNTASAMYQNKIKILSNIPEFRKEVEGYAWDDSAVEDRPIKVNDHCLTGDMLVMTDKGEVPIQELVGTSGQVWSFNLDGGKAELKLYHDCRMTQEMVDIYEVETEDGRIIKCTAEHPILTERGYIMVKDLILSDNIIDITV